MARRSPHRRRGAFLLLGLAITVSLPWPLTAPESQQSPSPDARAPDARTAAAPTIPPRATAPTMTDRKSADKRLSNGCRLSGRGVPQCGALLGAAHGANTSPACLERRIGRRLGVRRTYWRADQIDSAVSTARADLRAGRLPWISFKLPVSWEAMNSPWGASWARDLARRLRRLPGPVWIAFHHEPEHDGDILTWKRMQQRLIPTVRRTAPNVAFTVVLTGWHQFYGARRFRLERIFPRGAVDVVGFDVYNEYGVVRDGHRNTTGTNLTTSYFAKISRFAQRRGVAWGLAETGYADAATRRYPGWIQRTYRSLRRRGGVAYSYFDTPLNSIADWTLRKAVKREDFTRAIRGSPRFPRW